MKLLPYIVLAVVAVVLGGHLAPSMLCACPTYTDFSLINLEIDRAKHGEVLTGSYSRLGFRHPGPAMIYLYAAGDFLGRQLGLLGCNAALTQFLFNFGSLAAVVWIVARRISASFALLLIAAVVERLSRASPTFWSLYWNPAAVPLPALLAIVAAALVLLGEWRFVVVLAVALSVMVQAHLGAAPMAAALGLSVLAMLSIGLIRGTLSRGAIRWVALSVLVALLIWAPPILEFVRNRGSSNLVRIALILLDPAAAESRAGISSLLLFYGIPSRVSPWGPLVSLIAVVSGLFFLFRRRAFERALLSSWAITFMASVAAITQAKGDWHSYLMWYQYSAAALLFALLGWAVVLEVAKRAPQRAALVGNLLLGVLAIYVAVESRRSVPLKCRNTPLEIPVDLTGEGPIVIDGEPKGWAKAALLYKQLYSKGHRPCTAPKWRNLFGRDLTCPSKLSDPVRRVSAVSRRQGAPEDPERVDPDLETEMEE